MLNQIEKVQYTARVQRIGEWWPVPLKHDHVLLGKDLFINLEVQVVRKHPLRGTSGIIKGSHVNNKGQLMAKVQTYGRAVNEPLEVNVKDLVEIQ